MAETSGFGVGRRLSRGVLRCRTCVLRLGTVERKSSAMPSVSGATPRTPISSSFFRYNLGGVWVLSASAFFVDNRRASRAPLHLFLHSGRCAVHVSFIKLFFFLLNL